MISYYNEKIASILLSCYTDMRLADRVMQSAKECLRDHQIVSEHNFKNHFTYVHVGVMMWILKRFTTMFPI